MLVEVRSWPEVERTLDAKGMLDALPFMPEMMKYCGKRFVVSRRLERTCEEIDGEMRRIRDTVFLEQLRCDGTRHGKCEKGCFLFWKDAWLKPVQDTEFLDLTPKSTGEVKDYPYNFMPASDEYICQSTELRNATEHLPPYDLGMYVRDVRAKTYSVSKLARVLAHAVFLRVRRRLTGQSYRFIEGAQARTPVEKLDLQPGDLVRVKTKDEIAQTLDKGGKNRGLAFTVEMLPFCGKTFRVLRRLEHMIQESSHKIVAMDSTVILEGVTCDGCHILRGGCPRENFHFWREIWLKRVDHAAPQAHIKEAETAQV